MCLRNSNFSIKEEQMKRQKSWRYNVIHVYKVQVKANLSVDCLD